MPVQSGPFDGHRRDSLTALTWPSNSGGCPGGGRAEGGVTLLGTPTVPSPKAGWPVIGIASLQHRSGLGHQAGNDRDMLMTTESGPLTQGHALDMEPHPASINSDQARGKDGKKKKKKKQRPQNKDWPIDFR